MKRGGKICCEKILGMKLLEGEREDRGMIVREKWTVGIQGCGQFRMSFFSGGSR